MSTLTMRRLQAPARHKLGSDQHQRRALWPPLRETAGRFGASQSFDWDRHRRPNVIARVHDIPGLTTGCGRALPGCTQGGRRPAAMNVFFL